MFDFLRLAFGSPATPANPHDAIDPAVARGIVARHSHGNVRLQAGRFVTKDDVDATYRALKGDEAGV